MYLSRNNQILPEEHTCFLETDEYVVFWEGLIFVKGIPCGEESVEFFLKKVKNGGIREACQSLSGNFSCILYDKSQKKYHAFIDNDGFSLLFFNNRTISTSFLTLTNEINPTFGDLNPFAVIEFVHSGWIFGSTPFFNNIRIVDPDQLITFSEHGLELISEKKLENICPCLSPKRTFLETFSNIAISLKNKKISLDLTGGTDTRLLALLFKNEGVKFEAATMGTPGHPDVKIAGKLATLLDLSHHIAYHNVRDTKALLKELDELFVASDGLCDIFRMHKFGYYLQKGRKHRGIDLVITGNGGELYKFAQWWTIMKESRQDTIVRLARSGKVSWYSSSQIPYDFFSDQFRKFAFDYKSWLVSNLTKKFTKGKGKTLADKIFFEYSVRGSYRAARTNGRLINVYAPLLDRELVACALAIPAYDRFFSNFHRKLISSLNRQVAQMETTEPKYGYWKGASWLFGNLKKKFERKLKRLNKHALGKKKLFDPSLYYLVKHSEIGRKNIEYLTTCGILRPEIDIEKIDDECFGRLFSLSELLKRVNA